VVAPFNQTRFSSPKFSVHESIAAMKPDNETGGAVGVGSADLGDFQFSVAPP
jgi:hypothetical protein